MRNAREGIFRIVLLQLIEMLFREVKFHPVCCGGRERTRTWKSVLQDEGRAFVGHKEVAHVLRLLRSDPCKRAVSTDSRCSTSSSPLLQSFGGSRIVMAHKHVKGHV